MVERQKHVDGETSLERRFYMTSFAEDAKKLAHATRITKGCYTMEALRTFA